ncbi:hypothetical protein RclHR1_08070007 [Rhizophagus clarus]|uniref:Uncharacterized protein n=1 Tax=Rhizophagus clarus TaxID=94130 RepID=A0A2Z6S699_9GLOM|nr:hypothetical protein RclHR1_08070007 [Rhizophagus clarus]
MGSILADSNEAMRCEYISAILHASLYIVKRITDKELTLTPQLEIVGEETSEWYFILFTSDGISSTSKDPLNIRFSESVLKEGSEEEKDLVKNVKRVMEVIVGLLKDRLESVDEEPDRKKARIEEYRLKK